MMFQSTLPRRERLSTVQLPTTSGGFNPRSHEGSDPYRPSSTHGRRRVSIHAPTKGATRDAADGFWVLPFQSTLPRRERHHLCTHNSRPRAVSIHAPTKGATDLPFAPLSFQPFQSTLPRRERRMWEHGSLIQRSFNPRSHEGSDEVRSMKKARRYVFQSTLPRRERPFHGTSAG